MKKAAIITLNFDVREFITPELELYGYEVIAYTNVASSFELFDFVIVEFFMRFPLKNSCTVPVHSSCRMDFCNNLDNNKTDGLFL